MKNKFFVICATLLGILLGGCANGGNQTNPPSPTPSPTPESRYIWNEDEAKTIMDYNYGFIIPRPQVDISFNVSYDEEEKLIKIISNDIITDASVMDKLYDDFEGENYQWRSINAYISPYGHKTYFSFNKELIDKTNKKRIVQVRSYLYDEAHPYDGWDYYPSKIDSGTLAILLKDSNYDFPVDELLELFEFFNSNYKNPLLPPYIEADKYEVYPNSLRFICTYNDPQSRKDGGYEDILRENGFYIYENSEIDFCVASSPDLAYSLYYTYNKVYGYLVVDVKSYVEVRKFTDSEWSEDILVTLFNLTKHEYFKITPLDNAGDDALFTYYLQFKNASSQIPFGKIDVEHINKTVIDNYTQKLASDGWVHESEGDNLYKLFTYEGVPYERYISLKSSSDNTKLEISYFFNKSTHDFTSWPTEEIKQYIWYTYHTNETLPIFKRSVNKVAITETSGIIVYVDDVESSISYFEGLLDDEGFVFGAIPHRYNSPNRMYSVDMEFNSNRFYIKFRDPFDESMCSKVWPSKILAREELLGEKASLLSPFTGADRYFVSDNVFPDGTRYIAVMCYYLSYTDYTSKYSEIHSDVMSYLENNYDDYPEDSSKRITSDGSLVINSNIGAYDDYMYARFEITFNE